jgi:hypothetical protein
MNKKGKKFEVIWVSRDRTAEEFVEYYQKMPWLAVTIENLNEKLASLAQTYQLKGIPHLVIIDGEDGSIITLDGRTMVLKDKYGLEFPWRPRTLMNLLPKSLKHAIESKIARTRAALSNLITGLMQSIAPQQLIASIITGIKETLLSFLQSVLAKSKN